MSIQFLSIKINSLCYLGFYCLFDNNEDFNEVDVESLVLFYLSSTVMSIALGELLEIWKLKLAHLKGNRQMELMH